MKILTDDIEAPYDCRSSKYGDEALICKICGEEYCVTYGENVTDNHSLTDCLNLLVGKVQSLGLQIENLEEQIERLKQ